MTLEIQTFTNRDLSHGWRPGLIAGGDALFKALGHPAAAPKWAALRARLKRRRLALYDPDRIAPAVQAYYDLHALNLGGYFVQRLEDVGAPFQRHKARTINDIKPAQYDGVFALMFDSAPRLEPLAHLFGATRLFSLDGVRLDDSWLSNPRRYLDPLNFATNFAFFRNDEAAGLHTCLSSVNYWAARGAPDASLFCCLFDGRGKVLAQWVENLPPANALFRLDSRAVAKKFRLKDFCGSLFLHARGAKGHDVVKYAMDCYGAPAHLSCNHDANAWPADFYAGMPAGDGDETLWLYVQNSHPVTIPAHAIGFGRIGRKERATYPKAIPPFATQAINVTQLLPAARYPDQIEISAGRYFVRPRYEVVRNRGRRNAPLHRRIAHANVERTDLQPDKALPKLQKALGRGYIMPLPLLPQRDFTTHMLPCPMAREQKSLPLRADLFAPDGRLCAQKFLGNIPRARSVCLDMDVWLAELNGQQPKDYGHVEFVYDFRAGGDGDGWMHVLARFEQRASGHRAETIFGAHIFNIPFIYKDEPQSYVGRPPGLSTRLFLRLAPPQSGLQSLCHLIYPASRPWHRQSDTHLLLHNAQGACVAQKRLRIPCHGSRFFVAEELFASALKGARSPHYILVRDTSCRLFGFHGLQQQNLSFCLDHMFGF